ncbi:MBL fold metallo-hydrolase [Streptomyces sp. NPDC059766]|uniref:MBL fold metallo-hydrolase n=1 Tax=Streptomyces sp. NPDC059766 TaxID=3346940 RepID=UPI0036493C25
MTAFAPVPDFAKGPDIPEPVGYHVTDLGSGAYGITSGMVNTLFLETRRGVVVVDAPPDLEHRLLQGIEEVSSKPVTHLIYSHAHADHIASAHLLVRDGVTVISHELTARFIREANDPRRTVPNETFSGTSTELKIDGERFVLEYTGDWHQPGNLFIQLPERRILVAIDSFTVKNAPFFRLLFAPHVPAYYTGMDQMLAYDFDTVVSGHMALYGTPEDVQTHREYLKDLRDCAVQALGEVDLKQAAVAAGVPADNKQARLKVWIDAVVTRAAELMPASWGQRVGGHDIFLNDNLNAVAWSVFMD